MFARFYGKFEDKKKVQRVHVIRKYGARYLVDSVRKSTNLREDLQDLRFLCKINGKFLHFNSYELLQITNIIHFIFVMKLVVLLSSVLSRLNFARANIAVCSSFEWNNIIKPYCAEGNLLDEDAKMRRICRIFELEQGRKDR